MKLPAILPEPGAMRTLTVSTLVNTVGKGLFIAIAVVYYTRVVGLPTASVGVALSVAALIGVIGATPLGHLADRLGPRETVVAATAMSGLVGFSLLVAHSFWPLLAAVSAWSLTESASHSARGALIASVFGPNLRLHARVYLRSVSNIGIMLGVGGAALALQLDTPQAYRWILVGDAVSYLATALIMTRLPYVPPAVPRSDGPRLVALRDRPYLVFAGLNGVLAVHYGILEIGVPLWIVDHTAAPRWMVSVALAINACMVVLLQVRASRGIEATSDAARAMRRAGLLIAAACLLYASAAAGSVWRATAAVVLAASVHVVGELWHAAGGFALSYDLAPEGRHGQYQGTFGMGFQLSQLVAPVLITTLALGLGTAGWAVLAVMFAATGLLVPPVVRWAERATRHLTVGRS